MTTPDDRLNSTFETFLEGIAKANLAVINSEIHPIIGRYSGTAVMGDGEKIEVEGLVDFVEEYYSRG